MLTNPNNSSEQFQKDKLKLLSFSKNLLQLAEAKKWDELEVLQNQWQSMLDKMISDYGEKLEIIRPMLLDDAEKLSDLLGHSQKDLASDFSNAVKANQSIKKYVKF